MNVNMKNVKISGIRKFYNEVQKVENWIKQYPREILGWNTTDEMYKLEQAI